MRKTIVWTILMVIFALGCVPLGEASPTVAQLSSPADFSLGAVTIDFEGLIGPLTNQIPGLTFHYTSVIDPAPIGNSPGIEGVYSNTSGTATAFSFGSRIDFSTPVTEVGTFVSPNFINYLPGHTPVYVDMFLVALDSSDTQIGEVSVPVLRVTNSIPDIESFTPVFLGLKSDIPISAVTIDWTSPLYPGGTSLRFDDLMMVFHPVIDIIPEVVKLTSNVPLMVCRINLPPSFSASDIDTLTITLDGGISPVLIDSPLNSHLLVRFDMPTVKDHIVNVHLGGTPPPHATVLYVSLTITFSLNDGTPFAGSDTIGVRACQNH